MLAIISGTSISRSRLKSIIKALGLVGRAGDQWFPAHDEIAAAAADLAAPEAVGAAHTGLGLMLAARTSPDRTALIRAGHHLASAGAEGHLRAVFSRYLVLSRGQGDERRVHVLAAELAGEAADPRLAPSLTRSLPIWARVRWSSARRLVALLVLLGLVAGSIAPTLLRPSPADGEMFALLRDSTGELRTFGAALHTAELAPGQSIALQPVVFRGLLSGPGQVRRVAWRPDGRKAVLERHTGDSVRTEDLYLYGDNDTVGTLSEADGDDGSVGWSPDGRSIAFTTARWRGLGLYSYDIGRIDLASGVAVPLTRGPWFDYAPRWSPDGSRVLFSRFSTSEPGSICWIAADGQGQPACHRWERATIREDVGWIDPSRFVVNLEVRGRQVIAIGSFEDESFTVVLSGAYASEVSPDGRFAIAHRLDPATGLEVPEIVALRSPGVSWPVRLPPGWSAISLTWRGGSGLPTPLARLALPDSLSATTLDASFKLTPLGFGPLGERIGVPIDVIRWRSLDSSLAVIDLDGTLRPRRVGIGRIEASAGGWVTDTFDIAISAPNATVVFRESWEAGYEQRWRFFGRPSPIVLMTADGSRAFWNRGDGSYGSGAYSREAWSGPGFGVEARLSLPVTRPQWQVASLGVWGGFRYPEVARWDHETSPSPQWNDPDHSGACIAAVPAGETFERHHSISLSTAGYGENIGLDTAILSGRWFRLALQILPDGRCAAAVNGRPIWLSPIRIRTDEPFTLMLGYASDQTRVLHGALEAWTGVRSGIDWSHPVSPR